MLSTKACRVGAEKLRSSFSVLNLTLDLKLRRKQLYLQADQLTQSNYFHSKCLLGQFWFQPKVKPQSAFVWVGEN